MKGLSRLAWFIAAYASTIEPEALRAHDAEHPHPHAQPQVDAPESAEPLSLELVYTADIWRAASGGVARSTRYLDNFDVLARADLDALVGWQGATGFVYGLYNNGKSLNALMGDAQVASNIETGVKALRLYEAWLDQKIGERASLRVGLYDLNSEFDALDASALFIGSAHGIGTDISQSGENGPSIFPVTSLAARLAIDLDDRWSVRAAVLDGVPGDLARPKRTAIRLADGDGALMIGEIERKLDDGKLIAGYWRYTALFHQNNGRRGRGNDGVYVRGEAHLAHEAGDAEQGLFGFFRLGIADGAINPFGSFASGGLTYAGVIPGRNEDQFGVAIAAALTSAPYRRAADAKAAEIALELTYRAPITSYLTIQPNLQYVFNPNADRATPNALALGIRAEIAIKF